jgi:Glycosyl transferase family 2
VPVEPCEALAQGWPHNLAMLAERRAGRPGRTYTRRVDSAAIVMPHYTPDLAASDAYLRQALDGLAAQTDPGWHLFLVDNASPVDGVVEYLHARTRAIAERVTVVRMPDNRGAGHARNVGVALARAMGCATVSYNDADDVSPPERIATVRATFARRPDVTVTFGAWQPIDADGDAIPRDRLAPHLQRILTELDSLPRELHDPFLVMATQVGYFMLTSATSVRTEIARAYPWPSAYSAEDLHTWYRYCAHGGTFVFDPTMTTGYRVTADNAGSETPERYGDPLEFWERLNALELDGFTRALEIAVARGIVAPDDRPVVAAAFHERTADVWRLCEQPRLQDQSLDLAAEQRRLVDGLLDGEAAVAAP